MRYSIVITQENGKIYWEGGDPTAYLPTDYGYTRNDCLASCRLVVEEIADQLLSELGADYEAVTTLEQLQEVRTFDDGK